MCRLLGLLSNDKIKDFSTDLTLSSLSLLAQSNADSHRKQSDGWGIALYPHKKPKTMKSPRPIYKEGNKLKTTLASIKSRSLLAHIRHASNPLGLPKNKIIGTKNNQPFTHGKYSFIHNGTLNIPSEVRDQLGLYQQKVRGQNDSEVLFWLLMKNISASKGNVKKALQQSIQTIWKTWEKMHSKPKQISQPYVGLNIILTNGRELWALCKYDGIKVRKDKSLTNFERSPYFEMRYHWDNQIVKVASERTTTNENWQPLKDGTLLHAWASKGKVWIKKCPIKSSSKT